jgi:hypothetical protein
MFFYDMNNNYLLKMATAFHLEDIDKWTFEASLQRPEELLSVCGLGDSNDVLCITECKKEAVAALESGNSPAPARRTDRRIKNIFADEKGFTPAMMREVLDHGFDETLNDLKTELPEQIVRMQSNQQWDEIKALLCPRDSAGMPVIFNAADFHTSTACGYLDLIKNLPIEDKLKLEIVFSRDVDGYSILNSAIDRKDQDLSLLDELILFVEHLNVPEEDKVRALSGIDDDDDDHDPSPLFLTIDSDPPEKVKTVLGKFLQSGLSIDTQAKLATDYNNGNSHILSALKGKPEQVKAYIEAVAPIKSSPVNVNRIV